MEELVDEAGEDAEEQNAAGVEKKRQVEEEYLGVEAWPGGRGRGRGWGRNNLVPEVDQEQRLVNHEQQLQACIKIRITLFHII